MKPQESSTLTLKQIVNMVNERRPCSTSTAKRRMRLLGIRPIGTVRTKPQRYAPETPAIILDSFGEQVVSMKQLRAISARARELRNNRK